MAQNLTSRTLKFALQIIKLFSWLPKSTEAQILGKQLLRSGTSVGAHYREASRARSKQEFISKIEGGLQELEETRYWLDLLMMSGIVVERSTADLSREVKELIAIFVTMSKKTKAQL